MTLAGCKPKIRNVRRGVPRGRSLPVLTTSAAVLAVAAAIVALHTSVAAQSDVPAAQLLGQRFGFTPGQLAAVDAGTALMGTLPIALGMGAGSEARRPLGLAVVGGLVMSQTLTLYVTPIFYIYMERLQERFGRRKVVATSGTPAPAG